MPAASAVAGLSPTARRFSPARVWLRNQLAASAMKIARYARNPNDRKVSPNSPSLLAKGSVALKHAPVRLSAMEPPSPNSEESEPPKKLPTPTPNVVSARPVTFWLARSVTVRKL